MQRGGNLRHADLSARSRQSAENRFREIDLGMNATFLEVVTGWQTIGYRVCPIHSLPPKKNEWRHP
jgi:hypothetical protein